MRSGMNGMMTQSIDVPDGEAESRKERHLKEGRVFRTE